MDISKAFQAGARKEFPSAEICFDAFHVYQLVHDALDAVRRSEVKEDDSLKGSRWGFLKSPKDWTAEQSNDMHWLQRSGLKTARAWRMKQRLKEIHQPCRSGADPEPLYRSWISWARRSRLDPFKRLGNTLKSHLQGSSLPTAWGPVMPSLKTSTVRFKRPSSEREDFNHFEASPTSSF